MDIHARTTSPLLLPPGRMKKVSVEIEALLVAIKYPVILTPTFHNEGQTFKEVSQAYAPV